MSKSIIRKKRLEQPQITIPLASQVISLNNIKPRTCMLSSSYIHYSDQISKNFRVKLRYCKKLVFTEMPPELEDQSAKQLPSIYKRMKYLRGIDVTSLMMASSSDKLYKIMQRLSSVKIRIENGLFWDRYCHTSKIFRHLSRLSLNTFKVKIVCDLGNTNERLNLILKSLIQGVKYMGNLKSFGLEIQRFSKISGIYDNKNQSRSLLPSEQILRKSILSHFSKLKKIEKLSLVFFGPPTSALGGFTERFNHLSSLRTIKIVSGNQAQGTKLIENLTGMNSLKSVTLYQYFEPNNIISLAIKTPCLKSLRIKENWFFNSRQMSALKQARAKQIDVAQLHLDLNINIGTKQESEFIANFIGAFSKVKSLRFFMQCDIENLEPNQIAKQINKLTQLQSLEIGLNMKSGAALSQFFFLINDLVQLKTVSLVLKTSSQKGWDSDIQEIYPAIRGFLLQSKFLKKVILNWDEFSPKCAEALRLILNEIIDLDLFQLRYRPVFLQHKKDHDKILNVFEKTFKKTTAKFKNLNLVSTCTSADQKKDCRSKMNKVEKVAAENPNIHEFSAYIDRSPFYLCHNFF